MKIVTALRPTHDAAHPPSRSLLPSYPGQAIACASLYISILLMLVDLKTWVKCVDVLGWCGSPGGVIDACFWEWDAGNVNCCCTEMQIVGRKQ